MEVSPPSVNQMMKTLEKKGFIRRKPKVLRSIEILLPPDSIPRWRKRITTTRRVWMVADPHSRSKRPAESAATIYRFKIKLNELRPVVWRRIETKDVTLDQLHLLIQGAMGWMNSPSATQDSHAPRNSGFDGSIGKCRCPTAEPAISPHRRQCVTFVDRLCGPAERGDLRLAQGDRRFCANRVSALPDDDSWNILEARSSGSSNASWIAALVQIRIAIQIGFVL